MEALAEQEPARVAPRATATVAVVVIGRNEGARLARCLDSIGAARFPANLMEIVYVDSASTDDSCALARARGARVISVTPSRPSAACGRNAGWRATDAEYVLFLDGDTILHPDFLAHALDAMRDRRCAIVWGHRREIAPESSIYNRVLDLDWIYPPGPSEFCGGDALMRRAVLAEVGGFDAELIAGEEPELCHRIRQRGYFIDHVDHPMTGHDLALQRFGQYWKRAVRAGHAYAEVSERFRGSAMPLWEREVRRNRIHAHVLAGALVVGIGASLAARTPLFAIASAAFLAALVLRTATKVGWKDARWSTRVLYALHSHLQQIPIYVGQLRYAASKRRGERQALIEYKEPAR
ncbi:MAG: glycosyltransferase [Planctomycetota bacterium]